MKAAKWRDLSEDELTQKARDLSEEIFNLRFQLSMGVAKNPSRIGQARRDLARAYTIQRERGGSPLAVTAAVAAPATERATPDTKKSAAKAKAAAKPGKAAKASKAAKAPKAAAKKKTAKG
jgi:large subunit ribosomal protein L29